MRVWPSGAARPSISCAMLPPAPGRLSTVTGWPSASERRLAMMRDVVSVPPPGAKPTSMVIGRVGQDCASALAEKMQNRIEKMIFMSLRLYARFLDQPCLDLRFLSDLRAEILWRFRSRSLGAVLCQRRLDLSQHPHLCGLGIQALHDLARRA